MSYVRSSWGMAQLSRALMATRNKDMSSEGLANSREGAPRRFGISQHSHGHCSETSAHKVRIAMNGQEYNPRFTCRCFQLISSLNTVQIRHGDVCDDNIGRHFIVCSTKDRPLATFPTTSNSEGRRCSGSAGGHPQEVLSFCSIRTPSKCALGGTRQQA